jgi:hypothetical protein
MPAAATCEQQPNSGKQALVIQSSTISHQSSVIGHLPSAICHLPLAIRHQPSIHQPSTISPAAIQQQTRAPTAGSNSERQ